MDSNTRVIMDATGCTETEAQNVLEESGGSLSKALAAIGAGKKDALVFHIRYTVQGKENETGFASVIVNTASEAVLYCDMVFPLEESQSRMLDLNMPPTIFASTIKSIRNRLGERAQGSSRSNAALLKSKLVPAFVQSVVAAHRKAQVDVLAAQFAKMISGVIGQDIQTRVSGRESGIDALASILGQDDAAHRTSGKGLFDNDAAAVASAVDELPSASPQEKLPKIVLICEPEISPVHGRPARDLAVGEEIIVKIKDGRIAARYYGELLGGIVKDEVIPLCVPVIRVDRPSDTFCEAYVEFGPGIYGQFFLPPDVKVKTRDEGVELYNPFQDEKSIFESERAGKKIFIELAFLIVVILGLIAAILITG